MGTEQSYDASYMFLLFQRRQCYRHEADMNSSRYIAVRQILMDAVLSVQLTLILCWK